MYGSSVAQENHLCSRKICFSPMTCICNEKPETAPKLSLSNENDLTIPVRPAPFIASASKFEADGNSFSQKFSTNLVKNI
jgi:hypothetical protein